MLQAGTARVDITPPVGIAHVNWGARTHDRAEGVHQALLATALWLEGSATAALIIDLDHLLIPTADCHALRRIAAAATGLLPEQVRIACSHTHSGPPWPSAGGLGFGPDLPGMELVQPYREMVEAAIDRIAREAREAARPVRGAAGHGRCDVTRNRRWPAPDGRIVVGWNEAGFSDPTLTVLRLDDLEERPVATIVGYGTHPIVLAARNRLISPDYPGTLRQTVETLIGGVCLFLQGAAGDQIPSEALVAEPLVAERIGRRIGVDAAAVALRLRTRKVERRFLGIIESGAPLADFEEVALPDPEDRLAVITATVDLPLRDWGSAEARRAAADRALAALHDVDRKLATPAELADLGQAAKRAAMRAMWAARCKGRSHLPVELQAIRIGEAAFVSAPLEIFALTGARVREASPFAVTQLAGYSNGWEGYVPLASDFPRGGYEVEWASPFTEEAGALLEQRALDLLARLALIG